MNPRQLAIWFAAGFIMSVGLSLGGMAHESSLPIRRLLRRLLGPKDRRVAKFISEEEAYSGRDV
jgi:tRNA-dihydrouridine synthase